MSTEVVKSQLDPLKWLIAIAILAAGMFGFYYYEQYPILYRVLALVAIVIAALLIIAQTQVGQVAWGYITDSRIEMRKVVWPTKVETWQTTLLIMVFTLLVAVFFWGFDKLIGWGLGKVLGVEA